MSTNTAPSSLTRIHQGAEIPLPGVYELDGAQSKVGFEASTHIDREDDGLTGNQPLAAGGVLVGRDVTIEIETDAVRRTRTTTTRRVIGAAIRK